MIYFEFKEIEGKLYLKKYDVVINKDLLIKVRSEFLLINVAK